MSDETEVKGRSERDIRLSGYEAYLRARASGTPLVRVGPGDPTLFEHYAIALGVHHFYAGLEPISAGLLEEKAFSCAPDLGPSPPDPGDTPGSHGAAVERLADYLEQHFPADEPGQYGGPEGETPVDVAVRLLEQFRSLRTDMEILGEKMGALRRQIERDFNAEFPRGNSAFDVAGKLLDELVGLRKLAAHHGITTR